MKKNQGIKMKLFPKEGEGCILVPLREEDLKSEKYAYLKKVIGSQHFRDGLPQALPEDIQIEELGEDEEEVDIDIDPENIGNEELEVIKALYDDNECEELDDDFILKANLDEVLEEYKDDVEDVVEKVPLSELESAMDEFIEENKHLYNKTEAKLDEKFERIPFENDHVLQAVLAKESESEKDEESGSSENEEKEDDVVSHASQFTNTENRPEIISVIIRPPKVKKVKASKDKEEEGKGVSGKRPREETKEEKKSRKDKIKADKKATRAEKKKLKELQRDEKIKDDTRKAGKYDVRQGTSVIKLS